MKTKFFTLILAFFAITNILAQSGTCGPNLTWALRNGVLTISGSGDMTNYTSSSHAPALPSFRFWVKASGGLGSLLESGG